VPKHHARKIEALCSNIMLKYRRYVRNVHMLKGRKLMFIRVAVQNFAAWLWYTKLKMSTDNCLSIVLHMKPPTWNMQWYLVLKFTVVA